MDRGKRPVVSLGEQAGKPYQSKLGTIYGEKSCVGENLNPQKDMLNMRLQRPWKTLRRPRHCHQSVMSHVSPFKPLVSRKHASLSAIHSCFRGWRSQLSG